MPARPVIPAKEEDSFAVSDKAQFWSKKNIKSPREVSRGSGEKYIFDCNICGHEFTKAINQVNRGRWCPFCVNQELCENADCESCYNKSFASIMKDEIYGNWSSKNTENPRMIFKSAKKKYLFDCKDCTHVFLPLKI